jgi:hypothetical protein
MEIGPDDQHGDHGGSGRGTARGGKKAIEPRVNDLAWRGVLDLDTPSKDCTAIRFSTEIGTARRDTPALPAKKSRQGLTGEND